VAYSPGGDFLLVAQAGGAAIKLSPDGQRMPWGAGQARAAANATDHSRVALSPDGTLAAVAGPGGLALYDPARLRLLRQFGRQAKDVAFADDGRLVAASDNGAVRVWDAELTAERVLRGPARAVRRVAISRDGTRIAAVEQGGAVRVWDGDSGKVVLALPDAGAGAGGVAFSPNGLTLVIASGKEVYLWGPASR
jgi:WD40 repeat protein